MNVVLTGFMGTGKSAVGRRLASDLGLKYVDTDGLIEKETGKTIPEIFSHHGEAYFRNLEKVIVGRLTKGEFGQDLVVSTGGGVVVDPDSRRALKEWAPVVCLEAGISEILRRVGGNSGARPLLDREDKAEVIKKLLDERRPAYHESDLVVDTTYNTPEEVVRVIEDFLRSRGLLD